MRPLLLSPLLPLLLLLLLHCKHGAGVTLEEARQRSDLRHLVEGDGFVVWPHIVISAGMLFGLLGLIWAIVFFVTLSTGAKRPGRPKADALVADHPPPPVEFDAL